MAQAINVAATRKQITTKLATLENSIDAWNKAVNKYDADLKAAEEKHEKDLAAWNVKAAKALIASAKNIQNVAVDIRGTSGATIYLNSVDLSALTPRPEFSRWKFQEDVVKANGKLYAAIPSYYDSYNRPIPLEAVKFHFKKALQMLELLPTGTVEVQVKDFNFLNKF